MNQSLEAFANSDAMPVLWFAGIVATLFVIVILADAVRQRLRRPDLRPKGK